MRPASIEKLILLTAVSPPKRLTTSFVSRIRAVSATICPLRLGLDGCVVFRVLVGRGLQLALAPSRGDYPRRPVDHHEDEDDAEDETLVLRGVELVGKVLPVEIDYRDHRLALPELCKIEREAL